MKNWKEKITEDFRKAGILKGVLVLIGPVIVVLLLSGLFYLSAYLHAYYFPSNQVNLLDVSAAAFVIVFIPLSCLIVSIYSFFIFFLTKLKYQLITGICLGIIFVSIIITRVV